jgi:hypothetical protein
MADDLQGLRQRQSAELPGRREKMLMLTQSSFDERMAQMNARLDGIEEAIKHVTALQAGLIEQFPDFLDAMSKIDEEFNSPIDFERGPDGRLAKATRGKRSVSIRRDDVSRFSGAR